MKLLAFANCHLKSDWMPRGRAWSLNVKIWIKFPPATYVFVVGRISFFISCSWWHGICQAECAQWPALTHRLSHGMSLHWNLSTFHTNECACVGDGVFVRYQVAATSHVRSFARLCSPTVHRMSTIYEAEHDFDCAVAAVLRIATYIWTNASATFTTNSDLFFCA